MNEETLINRLLENNEKQIKLAQIKYYIVCALLAASLIGNFILMGLSRTTYIDADQDNNGDYNINDVSAK